jgi:multisubunit Na+/H+ antiporter MnhB subunit
MLIGAEIAMLIVGIYALIAGRLPTSKAAKYEVRGWPARVIGAICLLPIPLALAAGVVAASRMAAHGTEVTNKSFFWVGTAVEGGIVVACIVAVVVIRLSYRTPVAAQQAGDSRAEVLYGLESQ